MLSRRKFRRLCIKMWPRGVTMEGDAMDALRVALMRRGVDDYSLRQCVRAFLAGPPGYISRADVVSQLPERQNGVPDQDLATSRTGVEVPMVTHDRQTFVERDVHDPQLDHNVEERQEASVLTQSPQTPTVIPEDDEFAENDAIQEEGHDIHRRYEYVGVVEYGFDADDAEVQWANSRVPIRYLHRNDRVVAEQVRRQRNIQMAQDRVELQRLERNRRAQNRRRR
jgi:hypothetical protein